MPSAGTAFAILFNTVPTAYTAFRYARFAFAPGDFDDTHAEALATLFIAQFPLAFLGAAFAGAMYIEGPAWQRVVAYVVVVALAGVVSGFALSEWTGDLGVIVAWGAAMQVAILVTAGPQPALARARIDAVVNDAANLLILSVIVGLIATAAALLFRQYAGTDFGDWRRFEFEISDLAWVGAAFFAARTWSGAYAFTGAFEARRKGYFERPWIERVVRFGKAPRDSA